MHMHEVYRQYVDMQSIKQYRQIYQTMQKVKYRHIDRFFRQYKKNIYIDRQTDILENIKKNIYIDRQTDLLDNIKKIFVGQKDSFNEPKNLFLLFKRFSNRVSTRHSAKFSPTVAKKQILFKQFFRSGCKTVSKQFLEPFWKAQEMSGNKKALVMQMTSFTCQTN